ncbi:MAG: hypothetical protein OEY59_07945 [Deltaproteobacteria bacterium]|nr:hypothetical protein [Deltaproteobacteria bacterium]
MISNNRSFTGVIILVLISCATYFIMSSEVLGWGFPEDQPRDLKVSHYRHVVKEEIECVTCHEGAQQSDKAGISTKESCSDCHDEVNPKNDSQICLLCHNVTLDEMDKIKKELKKVITGPVPYKSLKFSHKLHYEKEIGCENCHKDIQNQNRDAFPRREYMPKPQVCFDCHEQKIPGFKVTEQCTQCHLPGTFARDVKPDFHRVNWKKYHGAASPMGLNEIEVHGKSCYTCHPKNVCVDCHSNQKPDDHTQFWRTRGHGFVAGSDRERCVNCHRPYFCVSCHNETSPRSHNSLWLKNHCIDCHDSGGGGLSNNCQVCHRSPPHLGN